MKEEGGTTRRGEQDETDGTERRIEREGERDGERGTREEGRACAGRVPNLPQLRLDFRGSIPDPIDLARRW